MEISNEYAIIPQQGGYKKIQPRWKPGQSGNPLGSTQNLPNLQKTLRKAIKKRITEGNNSMEVIIGNLLDAGIRGDISACVKIIELAYDRNSKKQ